MAADRGDTAGQGVERVTYPVGDTGRYVLESEAPLKPWDEAALERDLSTDADVELALRLGDAMRKAMHSWSDAIDALALTHSTTPPTAAPSPDREPEPTPSEES